MRMVSSDRADAVKVKELARTSRGMLGAAGVLLATLSGYVALTVSHGIAAAMAWSAVVQLAFLAVVLLAVSVHALHIAFTGRLRGRFNRLLRAIRDSFGNIQVP